MLKFFIFSFLSLFSVLPVSAMNLGSVNTLTISFDSNGGGDPDFADPKMMLFREMFRQ